MYAHNPALRRLLGFLQAQRGFDVDGRGIIGGSRGLEVGPTAGPTITIIEDWEGATPFNNWQGVNTGSAIVTTDPFNGSNHYEASNFEQIYSVPGDGLPAYFAQGEEMNVYVKVTVDDAQPWFGYGVNASTPTSDYFAVKFNFAADTVSLDDNSGSNIDSSAATLAAGVYYEVNIIWDDGSLGGVAGDHTVTFTDTDTDTVIATLTGNDTSHAANTGVEIIGQDFGSGGVQRFDYLHKVA